MFLAFDLSTLSSINYLFYLVIGLAVLAGFLRGLKKTLFNLVVMVIFYLVFFLTIEQAVNFLWTFEMPWLGDMLANVDPALANFTSFEASLDSLIEVGLGSDIDLSGASEEVIALATGLVQFALKIVWTIVYFTVIFILWKLIAWIIAMIFLGSKKEASKNRGLGALVGVLNGALGVFVLLIIMGGVMSVAESAVVLLEDNEPETLSQFTRYELDDVNYSLIPMAETTDMSEYVDDIQAVVDDYNNNFIVSLANNIQTTSTLNENVEVPLHIDLFDRVVSFEYNEATIGLRYELSVFSGAAAVFLASDYYDSNDITDITGDEIRSVFSELSKSQLIVGLMPVAIEVAADYFEQDLSIAKDDLYEIDFEEELANIGSIAGALFDILNNAGFIGGEGSVDEVEITEETVREVFTDISESQTILLVIETLLFPMITDGEEGFSTILEIPVNLDLEAEMLALGDIFAEIIAADIDFAALAEADVTVLLAAVAEIDLTVLLDSRLVSEALINILSGEADIEGLDVLTVPDGIEWYDTVAGDGELTKILSALDVLLDNVGDVDFNNLDVNALLDMSTTDIQTFFGSYVIRATVTDIVTSTALGDVPLIFPDTVYDLQDYFTETELVSIVEAVKLIYDSTAGDFDIMKALNLSAGDIDTLLSSDIIYATIGKEIYDLGGTSLVIPTDVLDSVDVNTVPTVVISRQEIKDIFEALTVLEITDLDTMTFDASILNKLENVTEDGLDTTKVNTLLGSLIIHATVSDMILDLDTDNGGVLNIPDLDPSGQDVWYTTSTTDYVDTAEIQAILEALYQIDITDFNLIDLEDTDLIITHLNDLLASAIIHATISQQILDLDTVITIPERDVDNQLILNVQGLTTYILDTELSNLMDALDVLGILNPTQLNTSLDLTVLSDPADQDIMLDSAIMHATVSDTLLALGSGILIIPEFEEDTTTPVQIERGSVGNEVTFVVKDEIKALIDTFIVMGFDDLESFGSEINTQLFLDNAATMLLSSALQATISDKILNNNAVTSGNLVIPDADQAANDIRIEMTDVTYISVAELTKFIDAVNTLAINDFDTFSVTPTQVIGLGDKDAFFSSDIILATVSKYILDEAGDETAATGTTILLVPNALRQAITVDGIASEQIEKAEVIDIFNGFSLLGINAFDDGVDVNTVSGLSDANLLALMDSGSFHVTIDNMLRDNDNINTAIPLLAETNLYGVDPLTTKTAIVNFIKAVNALGSGNFTNASFNATTVAGLSAAQRDIILDSMIVRNILTDELEATMLADPDPYWPANTDYMGSDPLTFLTEAGINNVFSHYGMI